MDVTGRYTVYCLHNLLNGKRYIGSTSSLERRIRQHASRPCRRMAADVAASDFNTDWRVSIMGSAPSLWQARRAEDAYIAAMHTTNPDVGYNCMQGHPGRGKNKRYWWRKSNGKM